MYLPVVLLLAAWMISGQPATFTINKVELRALPSSELRNGNHLQLKCLASTAKTSNFNLTSTFNFYKDDIPIHSITTTHEEVIYTIYNATVSRSGIYKCQIYADKKQKSSEEIKIKVTGLSAPRINITKYEVSEGDEITVRCELPNEEPPMMFYFHKTIKEVKESKEKSSINKNFAETTYGIKEGESILHFECSVKLLTKDEPESPLSGRQMVTVVESFGTPTIRVRPSKNFTEGAPMEVMCTVILSHRISEDVTMYLQKDDHILNTSTSGRLVYAKVATVGDTGNYTCKAEGKTASKTTSTMLKVKELFPRPRLTLKLTNNKTEYINDDDSVDLECSVPSLSPEELAKQNFTLIINGEQFTTQTGGKFNVDMKSTKSGNYTCNVTIANITKPSNVVQVKVYAPVAKPELKQIQNVKKIVVLGDTLILTCRSPAGTPPILYTLYQDKKKLERKEMQDNREAIFMVNTSKLHDLGQFQCQASNRNHKSNNNLSEPLNVTVIVPVREVSLVIIPENGEVEEGKELSLLCNVKNGTLPITFYFYVKKGSETPLNNKTITNAKHAELIVPSFTKENDGTYFCTASNKANTAVQSKRIEVKAILARWKKGVIGAFVILIIIAALGIALYLYLDKKKKGKNISTNSSRSSKAGISSSEKPVVDMKTDDSYFGSIQNEEELHILKTVDENIGNNQQNHEVEYTEADCSVPDPHHDSVENNLNEDPNINNLT